MRLYHQELLNYLPGQQILGQWRECIALLGNGWGKKHETVDYVFEHSQAKLVAYTLVVYEEMIKRGYKANKELIEQALMKRNNKIKVKILLFLGNFLSEKENIYDEHNNTYWNECIDILAKKGVYLNANLGELFKKGKNNV